MALLRATELAQMILRNVLHPGDHAVDATAGRGHDTCFLAHCVGPCGQVLAFDIQAVAIEATRARLANSGFADRVTLYQKNHCHMADHAAPASMAAVMFNLGYLPGADHDLTTTASDTLTAMAAATTVLRPGGLLSIVCYPGHTHGAHEAAAVTAWFSTLPANAWDKAQYLALDTLKPAPFLLIAAKRPA